MCVCNVRFHQMDIVTFVGKRVFVFFGGEPGLTDGRHVGLLGAAAVIAVVAAQDLHTHTHESSP